jgi:hypothetical protein
MLLHLFQKQCFCTPFFLMINVMIMKHEQDKKSKTLNTLPHDEDQDQEKTAGEQIKKTEQDIEKDKLQADAIYQFLKPLHNLPRGKNTWDPKIIKQWWFWPVSALFLIILFYVYPYIWDFFAG